MNITAEEALERYAANQHIPMVVARARVQRWIDMCTAQHNPVITPIPKKGKKPTVEEVMVYLSGLMNEMDNPDIPDAYEDPEIVNILNIQV